MSDNPEHRWRVTTETNVFLGHTGKSNFLAPDFLVYRCLGSAYQDVRGSDVVLVGEVLSPGNTQTDIEAKKGRYAGSGIPWYWEVTLAREVSAIATVRAYGLDIGHAQLPDGVHPLRAATTSSRPSGPTRTRTASSSTFRSRSAFRGPNSNTEEIGSHIDAAPSVRSRMPAPRSVTGPLRR
jgi:hypothetical protein